MRLVRRLAVMLAAPIMLSGCYNVFWQSGVLGHDTLMTQARAVRIDYGNEAVRTQLPNDRDFFLGRSNCAGAYCIVIKRMNWQTMSLTPTGVALQFDPTTGLTLGDHHLVSAPQKTKTLGPGGNYDPSVIWFHNEYWVAWECGVDGLAWPGQPLVLYHHRWFSSCLGPLRTSNGIATATIDVARSFVAVLGSGTDSDPDNVFSASVPKLLVHHGNAYLYWTQVHYKFDSTGAHTHDISTWGIPLKWDDRYNVLTVAAADGTILGEIDSTSIHKLAIWLPDSTDPNANTTVDASDVKSDGTNVYMIASVGGSGCTNPFDSVTSAGCYRMEIATAPDPMSPFASGARALPGTSVVPSGDLPANPVEYGFFFTDPSGTDWIAGMFGDPVGPLLNPQNQLALAPFNVTPYHGADPNHPTKYDATALGWRLQP